MSMSIYSRIMTSKDAPVLISRTREYFMWRDKRELRLLISCAWQKEITLDFCEYCIAILMNQSITFTLSDGHCWVFVNLNTLVWHENVSWEMIFQSLVS